MVNVSNSISFKEAILLLGKMSTENFLEKHLKYISFYQAKNISKYEHGLGETAKFPLFEYVFSVFYKSTSHLVYFWEFLCKEIVFMDLFLLIYFFSELFFFPFNTSFRLFTGKIS